MDGCFPTALGRQSTFSNKVPFSHHKAAVYPWESWSKFLVAGCPSSHQPTRIREETLESGGPLQRKLNFRLRTLKTQYCELVNFRPRKLYVVPNRSVWWARPSCEIEIVFPTKTTELTHRNRISPKKVSIIIFMLRSLCRDKLSATMLLSYSRALREWKPFRNQFIIDFVMSEKPTKIGK